jgi:protein-ribulosamine 3-kinase
VSSISDALSLALAETLGEPVRSASRIAGGDINDAFEVVLADGRELFVKTNDNAPQGMFSAEARGLGFLAEARTLSVPAVVAVVDAERGPRCLVLELLRSRTRRARFDEALGRGLAGLHAARPAGFGLDHDNFIGSLPQSNRPHANWCDFFRAERLEPQLRLAKESGRASSSLSSAFERLFARLPELLGPAEPPARLHGDLWGGNLHVDASGAPCLIDPAVYGGHREVDLAMMRLFGGFGERVFAAYAEVFPLAPGHAERVGLYQLYPLLVHVNLFGGGYAAQLASVLRRYA